MKEDDRKYGVDIAVQRADDLDRMMIEYVGSLTDPHVLDLGSGAGGQSVRLVKAGARVTAIDVHDYTKVFDRMREVDESLQMRLRFIVGDMGSLPSLLGERTFDACSIQRALHYIPYKQAVFLLRDLKKRIKGKLYISVSGLGSAIGEHYADVEKVVTDRFCRLDEASADTFSINKPLCLYTQEEFRKLLTDTGWEVLECWTSEFGNNKAICK